MKSIRFSPNPTKASVAPARLALTHAHVPRPTAVYGKPLASFRPLEMNAEIAATARTTVFSLPEIPGRRAVVVKPEEWNEAKMLEAWFLPYDAQKFKLPRQPALPLQMRLLGLNFVFSVLMGGVTGPGGSQAHCAGRSSGVEAFF